VKEWKGNSNAAPSDVPMGKLIYIRVLPTLITIRKMKNGNSFPATIVKFKNAVDDAGEKFLMAG